MATDRISGQDPEATRARLVRLTGGDRHGPLALPHLTAVGWVPGPLQVPDPATGAGARGGAPVGETEAVHDTVLRGAAVRGAAVRGPAGRGAAGRGAAAPDEPDGMPDAAEVHTEDAAAIRQRALGSAITAYTAAHGHPLEHPALGAGPITHRWATRPRVAVAMACVLALLCAGVVLRAMGQLPEEVDLSHHAVGGRSHVPGDGSARGSGTADAGTAAEAPDPGGTSADVAPGDVLVVHVVGQVVRPGVVTLDPGARVLDAIDAAGGPTAAADLAALNLARVVTDGEQVHVTAPGELAASSAGVAGGGQAAGAGDGLVNLNTADAAALMDLPGVGPVLAQRILDRRRDEGPFTSVDELDEVSGVGPAVLAGVRERAVV